MQGSELAVLLLKKNSPNKKSETPAKLYSVNMLSAKRVLPNEATKDQNQNNFIDVQIDICAEVLSVPNRIKMHTHTYGTNR